MTHPKRLKMPCTRTRTHRRAGITPSLRGADGSNSTKVVPIFSIFRKKKNKKNKSLCKNRAKSFKKCRFVYLASIIYFFIYLFFLFLHAHICACVRVVLPQKKKKKKIKVATY